MLSLWRFVRSFLRSFICPYELREQCILKRECVIVAIATLFLLYFFFSFSSFTRSIYCDRFCVKLYMLRKCLSSYLPKAFRRTIDFNFVISLILYFFAHIFPLSIFFLFARLFLFFFSFSFFRPFLALCICWCAEDSELYYCNNNKWNWKMLV